MKTRHAAYRLALRPVVAAAALLAVPLLATQLTDQVAWSVTDYLAMGALVVSTGVLFELARARTGDPVYRFAVGLALAGAFLLVWGNGAVGLIGSAGDAANLMYVGVLGVGLGGALLARFRPRGMARAMFAAAVAQASVAAVAILAGLGAPASGPGEILLLNGFFVALFAGSGILFREAARRSSSRDPAPGV